MVVLESFITGPCKMSLKRRTEMKTTKKTKEGCYKKPENLFSIMQRNADDISEYSANPQKITENKTSQKTVNVQPLTVEKCVPETLLLGCVQEVRDIDFNVCLLNGIVGNVNALCISKAYTLMAKDHVRDETKEVTPLHELFSKGDLVRCEVMESHDHGSNQPITLSVNPHDINRRLSSACLSVGMVLGASISSKEDHGYVIDLGIKEVTAFLSFKDASLSERKLVIGGPVLCCIKSKTSDKAVKVTVHPKRLAKRHKSAKTIFTLLPGELIRVKVTKIGKGIITKFHSHKATIHKDHMLPHHDYTIGSFIEARVLLVNVTTKKISLTHLPHLKHPYRADISHIDPEIGDYTTRNVKIQQPFDNDRFHLVTQSEGERAVCMFSSFGQENDLDEIKEHFTKRNLAKGTMIGVNLLDNMTYISLKYPPKTKLKTKNSKNSVTSDSELVNNATNPAEDLTHVSQISVSQPVIDKKSRKLKKDEQKVTTKKRKLIETPKQTLSVSCGFSWKDSFHLPMGDNSDESEVEGDTLPEPVKKKAKKSFLERQMEEEKSVYQAERALSRNSPPETVDAFDRLVLQSPNSSIFWLRYMAFYLEASNVPKARDVVERALKTIAHREEQEKLNVWMGYLNLENMYGTAETITDLIHRAARHNDPWKVYSQMVNIFVQSDKIQEAEQLLLTMMKKYKETRVWLEAATFYYKQSRPDAARNILKRALTSLDKTKHIEVISKFSHLECQFGDIEVGKTMFEQLLSTYSKRTDLWSVYIDIVIKAGQIPEARQIFHRLTQMNLPVKKMRIFFKKFLTFETEYGDAKSIETLKQMAMEYVDDKKRNTQKALHQLDME